MPYVLSEEERAEILNEIMLKLYQVYFYWSDDGRLIHPWATYCN